MEWGGGDFHVGAGGVGNLKWCHPAGASSCRGGWMGNGEVVAKDGRYVILSARKLWCQSQEILLAMMGTTDGLAPYEDGVEL